MMDVIVFGSINADLVQMVEKLPVPGETVSAMTARWSGGGKGANQAHAARGVLASENAVRFVGCVGQDSQGQTLLHELAEVGVDVSHVAVVPEPSGLAVVAVDDEGENTVIVTPGANTSWPTGHVEGVPVSADDVVVVQLEISLEEAHRVLDHARKAGATTILNAAPAHVGAGALLPLVDVLIVNQLEFVSLFGDVSANDTPGYEGDLVVTLGADGCIVRTRGVQEHVAAYGVDVVATVGAGDAFVGALAAELAAGADICQASDRGNAAGAMTAMTQQARASDLTPDSISHFIEGADCRDRRD